MYSFKDDNEKILEEDNKENEQSSTIIINTPVLEELEGIKYLTEFVESNPR